jgi:hypothetical protein
MIRMTALGGALAWMLTLAAAGSPPAVRPAVEGVWETPAGRLEIRRKGEKVLGKLISVRGSSPLPVGTLALEGTYFEDNLSGELRLGVVAPECGAAAGRAFVTLLLTRSGKLTGGASSDAACARDLPGVTFIRAEPAAAPAGHMAAPPVPDGTYDPRGVRIRELPKTTRSLMLEAQAALTTGRFEEARRLFEAVLATDSKVGEAYNGVGATFYARNDYDAAIDWYKRGLEAAPGFGDLYYNLACAYSLLGKKNMALRYLRLASAKGYVEIEPMDKDPDLDPLRDEAEFKGIRAAMEAPAVPLPE